MNVNHAIYCQELFYAFRQKALEDAGFIVLRFTDEEVLTAINHVYEKIKECVDKIESGRGGRTSPSASAQNQLHKGETLRD